jgi:hypothetical protein
MQCNEPKDQVYYNHRESAVLADAKRFLLRPEKAKKFSERLREYQIAEPLL